MCRFQEGVVFKICMDCDTIVGCTIEGDDNYCETCPRKKSCPIRIKHISEETHCFLHRIKASTSSLCQKHSLIRLREANGVAA